MTTDYIGERRQTSSPTTEFHFMLLVQIISKYTTAMLHSFQVYR
jgi:hypothetical protein